jgi:hypothetical protein
MHHMDLATPYLEGLEGDEHVVLSVGVGVAKVHP